MVNKDKIIKVSIYDAESKLIFSSNSIDWPRDFFKFKHKELCVIKGKNIPNLHKDTPVTVIFEYRDGTRVQCDTVIDICTEHQINIHVDDGKVLEERRRSFKISVELPGSISFFTRDEETLQFEDPIECRIKNINLGGVFFSCDYEFMKGDCVSLSLFDEQMDLLTEILRLQLNNDGELLGYGCKFQGITPQQEEKIARYIFDVQLAERERKRKLAGGL